MCFEIMQHTYYTHCLILLRDGGLFHDCMCDFMFPLPMFDFVLPVVSSVVKFFHLYLYVCLPRGFNINTVSNDYLNN